MVRADLPWVREEGGLSPEDAPHGARRDPAYPLSGRNKGRAGVGFASASLRRRAFTEISKNQRIGNSLYNNMIGGIPLFEVKA